MAEHGIHSRLTIKQVTHVDSKGISIGAANANFGTSSDK
jgi:hypothetical protein